MPMGDREITEKEKKNYLKTTMKKETTKKFKLLDLLPFLLVLILPVMAWIFAGKISDDINTFENKTFKTLQEQRKQCLWGGQLPVLASDTEVNCISRQITDREMTEAMYDIKNTDRHASSAIKVIAGRLNNEIEMDCIGNHGGIPTEYDSDTMEPTLCIKGETVDGAFVKKIPIEVLYKIDKEYYQSKND